MTQTTDFHHVFTLLCPAGGENGAAAVLSIAISQDKDDEMPMFEVLDAKYVYDPQAARDVLGVSARSGDWLDVYPAIEEAMAPQAAKRPHRRTRHVPSEAAQRTTEALAAAGLEPLNMHDGDG